MRVVLFATCTRWLARETLATLIASTELVSVVADYTWLYVNGMGRCYNGPNSELTSFDDHFIIVETLVENYVEL